MPARTSRTADKASVIAQLQPLLQPRLDQDGISWDEASPLLGQMPLDALQRALATTNVQPVWAKLRAAAYKRPALRKLGSSENLLQQKLIAQLQPALLPHLQEMGLSWDDALPEVKKCAEADLENCLVSGCIAPILEKLSRGTPNSVRVVHVHRSETARCVHASTQHSWQCMRMCPARLHQVLHT